MALSDTEIRKIKPAERRQRLFDGGGLHLEVAPTGGKFWRLKFRFDGKEKLLSLGSYPDTGLKEARKRRDEARQLLAEGTDSTTQRKALRHARKLTTLSTVESLACAWLDHRADAWVERARTIILASRRGRRDRAVPARRCSRRDRSGSSWPPSHRPGRQRWTNAAGSRHHDTRSSAKSDFSVGRHVRRRSRLKGRRPCSRSGATNSIACAASSPHWPSPSTSSCCARCPIASSWPIA